MQLRPLGSTGLFVTPLGFGAFKIGRNEQVKYPQPYDLPDDATVERLLNGVLDAGIHLIDTAPAYGLSEERIGKFLPRSLVHSAPAALSLPHGAGPPVGRARPSAPTSPAAGAPSP